MYDDIVYVCVYDFNILNKLEGEMQTNDKRKKSDTSWPKGCDFSCTGH